MNTTNLINRLGATIEASSPETLELFSQFLGEIAKATPGDAQEMWRSLANEILPLSSERRPGACPRINHDPDYRVFDAFPSLVLHRVYPGYILNRYWIRIEVAVWEAS